MTQFGKHFTLEQANALLPWVRSILADIHRIIAHIAADALAGMGEPGESAAEATGNGHGNGGNGHDTPAEGAPSEAQGAAGGEPAPKQPPWAELSHDELSMLIKEMLQALISEGLVIQDIERGLVDFPSWRQGREVMLCYEMSDGPSVNYWHDLGAGYASRQRIDAWPEE